MVLVIISVIYSPDDVCVRMTSLGELVTSVIEACITFLTVSAASVTDTLIYVRTRQETVYSVETIPLDLLVLPVSMVRFI